MRNKVLGVVLAAFCLLANPALAADKIKILFLVSLTGPWSVFGHEQERGLQVALEELGNTVGGLPVEIITKDDQGKPDAGLQQATQGVQLDKVDLITGLSAASVMMAIAKPMSDAGVLMISGNTGPTPLAREQCTENLFVVSYEAELMAKATAVYMSKVAKSAYLLSADFQAGWDSLNGVKEFYKGPVAGESVVPVSLLDFSSDLAKVRASRADTLYGFITAQAFIGFVKQWGQSGLGNRGVTFHGGVWTADDLSFPAEGDAPIGMLLAAHWFPQLDNPANRKFVAAFHKKFGRNPAMQAQQQYDVMMLLDSAVRAVKGHIEDRTALRNALRKADFASARGKFKFGTNQFPVQDYYIVKVVKQSSGELGYELVTKILEDQGETYMDRCPMRW